MEKNGQTLVEVVVAVSVVILLVTGLIVGTTSSIRGSEFSTYQSLSLKYAQEGIELARTMRDASWASLAQKSGLWCLDSSKTWTQAQGSCAVNINNFYTRSVNFTYDVVNSRMTVDVVVRWTDSSGMHKSELITYLTQWK